MVTSKKLQQAVRFIQIIYKPNKFSFIFHEVKTTVILSGPAYIEEKVKVSYTCISIGGEPSPDKTYWYLILPNKNMTLLGVTAPNGTLEYTPKRSDNGSIIYCTVTQLTYKTPSRSNDIMLYVLCKYMQVR